MTLLAWVVVMGLLMALIALSGSLTLVLPPAQLDRALLPLVAFAAGSLLGGAFLHLLPASLASGAAPVEAAIALLAGFALFLAMEQGLQWHHARQPTASQRRPFTYLILVGDGLHNFLGGLGVGAAFVADVRLGLTTWLAAAAHEVPQEVGDFAVLVHGGWPRRRALVANFLSGLTFLVGALLSLFLSAHLDVTLLMPFAAGNFVYIGAADLVPEVTRGTSTQRPTVHFLSFVAGAALMGAFTGLG